MTNFARSLRAVLGATTLVLLGGVAGCVDTDTPEVQARPVPITTLDTTDGMHLDFYEPSPAELVVFIDGDLPGSYDGQSPQAIYEGLSGQAAPAVLRDAQARADQARRNRTPDVDPADPTVVAPPARAPRGPSNLTAADFAASNCNLSPVDFDYCWTLSTSDYSIDISSVDFIHTHVNAYAGTINVSLWKKPTIGSWNLLQSDTVTGAATVVTQSETDNGKYRVSITNAAGDGYHLAIHGQQ